MKIREPVNTITHLIGVILSVFALLILVYISISNFSIANIISSVVFSLGLIGLYTASTVYHWKITSTDNLEKLRKIDHIMIFVLIAATYTPICLITLKGKIGYTLLGIIWSLTIIGIFLKIFWINAPRWLSTGIYLLLGWLAVFFIYPIAKALPAMAIFLLVLGGLMYTIGAVIYGTKTERLKIGLFGFHEIFHIFILLGSLFHFLMIFIYVIG